MMRRSLLLALALTVSTSAIAFAQDASERVRKINLYAYPQAALPVVTGGQAIYFPPASPSVR